MSALPQPESSLEAYLALDQDNAFKYEFIDGEILVMSGASNRHNNIVMNASYFLYGQLLEKNCQVQQSDMRVHITATHNYTYPDVVVTCGDVELEDGNTFDTLLNPTVIIEVLSPSTEVYDRGKKSLSYRSIPSLKEYLLIAQDRPQVEHYSRKPDNTWELRDLSGLDAVIDLTSIGCKLSLKNVYRKIQFEDEDEAE